MNQNMEIASDTVPELPLTPYVASDVSEYLTAIDKELHDVTHNRNPRYADLFNFLYYHLGWTDVQGNPILTDTGKHVRPLLCLWTCEAVGGDWHDALPAAAALELIHNFSLIHDDIQDNSDLRRGRPTLWSVWGIAHAINAGDAMFVLAQQALNETPPNLTLDRYVAIQRAFNAAILKLTKGQYLDLAYENTEKVTLDQYLEMVEGKTAALISAACEIGARIGSNDTLMHRTIANYGENLGIAFQIADDVLGLWGDPQVTGKSAKSDLLSRKKSFPVLYAMQTDAGATLREIYSKKKWTQKDIEQVEAILQQTDARHHALRQAEEYARKADGALAATNLKTPHMYRLRNLIQQLVYREK